MKVFVFYEIRLAGGGMSHPDTFETLDLARAAYEKHYKNRNKGDEHDEYWRNVPAEINKVTRTVETLEKFNS